MRRPLHDSGSWPAPCLACAHAYSVRARVLRACGQLHSAELGQLGRDEHGDQGLRASVRGAARAVPGFAGSVGMLRCVRACDPGRVEGVRRLPHRFARVALVVVFVRRGQVRSMRYGHSARDDVRRCRRVLGGEVRWGDSPARGVRGSVRAWKLSRRARGPIDGHRIAYPTIHTATTAHHTSTMHPSGVSDRMAYACAPGVAPAPGTRSRQLSPRRMRIAPVAVLAGSVTMADACPSRWITTAKAPAATREM